MDSFVFRSFRSFLQRRGFVFLAGFFLCAPYGLCQDKPRMVTDESVKADGSEQVSSDRLKILIQDLSSDIFAIRESATGELASQSNEKWLPDLEAAVSATADFESYIRLRGIVAKIKSERLETQIRGFMKSKDPNQTFGFDGWTTFSKQSGESRGAKRLFLKLLELHPRLVEQKLENKEEALEYAKRIAAKVGDMKSRLLFSEPGEGVALLYALNVASDLHDPSLEGVSIRTFRLAPFSLLLNESQFRKSLERMLVTWSTRVKTERLPCLLLFLEKELDVSRDVALDILESNPPKEDGDSFLLSMQALFRFGRREDVPKLERWLDDKAVCWLSPRLPFPAPNQFDPNGKIPQSPVSENYTVERRDLALLVLTRVMSSDLNVNFPFLRLHPLRGFLQDSVAMPADLDELRTKRIQAWRESRK